MRKLHKQELHSIQDGIYRMRMGISEYPVKFLLTPYKTDKFNNKVKIFKLKYGIK